MSTSAALLDDRAETLLKPGAGRQPSIQSKLTLLVVTSLATALLIASVMSMWHEANRFLRTRQETMLATANVFAAAASAAAASKDAHGVGQALRGLTRIPNLLYAEVTTEAVTCH